MSWHSCLFKFETSADSSNRVSVSYHALILSTLLAPNASQRKKTIQSATTYDRHYNETAPLIEQAAGVHFPTKARTVVRGKGMSLCVSVCVVLQEIFKNVSSEH